MSTEHEPDGVQVHCARHTVLVRLNRSMTYGHVLRDALTLAAEPDRQSDLVCDGQRLDRTALVDAERLLRARRVEVVPFSSTTNEGGRYGA